MIIGIIELGGEEMEYKELMKMFSSLLDEKLQPLNERLERVESGQHEGNERLERVESGQHEGNERLERVECGQRVVDERLERLESGQQVIIGKLENVSEQVASNNEKQTSVESVAVKVAEHDTDIKLLKKFITN
jgi:predicted nuclease with TOPRIM domain